MEFKPLNKLAQKELLSIARSSITSYVLDGKIPLFEAKAPALTEKRGIFVTITKRGNLRGCIGQHESDIPLYQLTAKMAVAAACKDPRFSPVTAAELREIKIKISVYLMPPTKITDISEFEIGRDGIIIEKGNYSATYLPEVAREQGWDTKETLSNLCLKAGLPPDAWQEGIELFIYRTQVFEE
jgi:AmmeMemoRadiSam system protein A